MDRTVTTFASPIPPPSDLFPRWFLSPQLSTFFEISAGMQMRSAVLIRL